MKRTKSILTISALPLAMALTGCSKHAGTLDGTSTGAITAGSVIAKTANDTASNKLKDGTTALKANAVTSTAISYDGGKVNKAASSDFSLKKNGNGVDLTVNGETITFSDSDLTPEKDGWEKQKPDGSDYKGAYVFDADSAKSALDGTDKSYLQVWQYESWNGDKATRGFAVIGAETDPQIVKSQANATYSGKALADTWMENDSRERAGVRGDLTLKADFQAGSVTGKIDKLEARTRGADTDDKWTAWAAADTGANIEMTKAAISANGFSDGKLVAHDPSGEVGNLDGSTYSGRFYGPNAEQVGGVMSIKGASQDGKFVGNGFFAGKKD